MAALALSGFLNNDGHVPDGTIVTAVFPHGCQLNCGFCIVRHRGERNTNPNKVPPPEFYSDVVHSYAARDKLAGVAIVGDEPLQAKVWPYVSAFLDAAEKAGRPSSLVTNGLGLSDFCERLADFSNTRIVVSIDGVGAAHDRIRRKEGAFETINAGMVIASGEPDVFDRLSVATILRPGRYDDAEKVLEWVSERGVKQWLVSALLDPRPGRPVAIHGSLTETLVDMLSRLAEKARRLGVRMIVTDEFSLIDDLQKVALEAGFPIRRPRKKPSLIRLDAHGRCLSWSQIANGCNADIEEPVEVLHLQSVR